MTTSTKKKLEEIVDKERVMAFEALEDGQLYQRQDALEVKAVSTVMMTVFVNSVI
jgi:hypothetical protein